MPLRFLFDEHVNKPACDALRERGIDVSHVLDIGLGGASDAEVFARAVREGRIVVTRNYRDFAMLVEAYRARGTPCPGVLFLPVSLSQADVGAHVRMVAEWIATHAGADVDHSPVADRFAWLTVG
jgi:predicted nuclease of predicted toxin-antitoxin system